VRLQLPGNRLPLDHLRAGVRGYHHQLLSTARSWGSSPRCWGDEIGWSEAQYGYIVSAFSFAYGIGFLGMGRLLDRIGVRRGFSFAIVAWSLAAMAHAFARSALGSASPGRR
jgi:MFS family permease